MPITCVELVPRHCVHNHYMHVYVGSMCKQTVVHFTSNVCVVLRIMFGTSHLEISTEIGKYLSCYVVH